MGEEIGKMFNGLVLSKFGPLLLPRDFVLSSEKIGWIEYMNKQMEIWFIYDCFRSYEIEVIFRSRGDSNIKFSLWDVFGFYNDKHEELPGMTICKEDILVDMMGKLHKKFELYIDKIINKGNLALIQKYLDESYEKQSKKLNNEEIRKIANMAWKTKDYFSYYMKISELSDELSKLENKRKLFAFKKFSTKG